MGSGVANSGRPVWRHRSAVMDALADREHCKVEAISKTKKKDIERGKM